MLEITAILFQSFLLQLLIAEIHRIQFYLFSCSTCSTLIPISTELSLILLKKNSQRKGVLKIITDESVYSDEGLLLSMLIPNGKLTLVSPEKAPLWPVALCPTAAKGSQINRLNARQS